jgi:hypothetical protein
VIGAPFWPLSHKLDPPWIVGAHGCSYCSLSNEFSTGGLKAYGPSFGDTVKTLYNDTVFFTVRIVILKVSLYSDFVRKTRQTSKLCNDIAYL